MKNCLLIKWLMIMLNQYSKMSPPAMLFDVAQFDLLLM